MSTGRTSSRRIVIAWSVLAAAGIPLPTAHAHAGTLQERADTEVPPKLKAILKEQLKVEERRITWDAHLVKDLGVDSLGCVELIMALEEEFGLEIPDESAEKFERVGDIVQYLRKRGVKTLGVVRLG